MMAGIMGVFQIVWVYYGLLIGSRPVIAWNILAVFINCLTVGAYVLFGERLGRVQLTGVAMILAGVATLSGLKV